MNTPGERPAPDAHHAPPALVADQLTRSFGGVVAVDHVSFSVGQGEIFGLLGPNGAGKSTTTRLLSGFLTPSSGRALISGRDVARHPAAAHRCMGVVPEEANVYADLSVEQNILLMAELHGLRRPEREQRCHELLHVFDLSERRSQKSSQLSKGLRQQLMLCMALIGRPQVLFLDEPTSGLDVASTRRIREVITAMSRDHGMAVLLTTHNMQEAEQLCHRVAILDRGRLVAIDSPAALRLRVAARRSVSVRFSAPAATPANLLPHPGMEVVPVAGGWRVYTAEPGPLAQHIAVRSAALGLQLESINTLEPTLEEVFLAITGEYRA